MRNFHVEITERERETLVNPLVGARGVYFTIQTSFQETSVLDFLVSVQNQLLLEEH